MEGGDASLFSINSDTGVIRTNATFDILVRESFAFSAVVTTAYGLKTTVPVNITIIDVNNHAPVFSMSPYRVSFYEKATVGTPILTVSSSDLDRGTNAEKSFIVVGGTGASTFALDANTGVITLVQPVDVVVLDSYTLIIAAVDHGSPPKSAVNTVYFTVLDVNLHTPVFDSPLYFANVTEHAPAALVLITSAADSDRNLFAQLTFSIVAGNSLNYFSVNAQTGALWTTAPLVYAQVKSYNLTLRVTDGGGLFSESTALVTVVGINNVAPTFSHQQYDVKVNESTTLAFLTRVYATDSDEGLYGDGITDSGLLASYLQTANLPAGSDPLLFGNIVYSLNASLYSAHFSIDSHTGFISLTAPLNYTETTSIVLGVGASDLDTPSFTGYATVVVTVDNVNIRPLMFRSLSYSAALLETAALNTVVTTVSAHDGDQANTPNSDVRYVLADDIGGTFAIDAVTDIITLKKTLDYNVRLVLVPNVVPRQRHAAGGLARQRVRVRHGSERQHSPARVHIAVVHGLGARNCGCWIVSRHRVCK